MWGPGRKAPRFILKFAPMKTI